MVKRRERFRARKKIYENEDRDLCSYNIYIDNDLHNVVQEVFRVSSEKDLNRVIEKLELTETGVVFSFPADSKPTSKTFKDFFWKFVSSTRTTITADEPSKNIFFLEILKETEIESNCIPQTIGIVSCMKDVFKQLHPVKSREKLDIESIALPKEWITLSNCTKLVFVDKMYKGEGAFCVLNKTLAAGVHGAPVVVFEIRAPDEKNNISITMNDQTRTWDSTEDFTLFLIKSMIELVPNVPIKTFLELAVDLDVNEDIAKHWSDFEGMDAFITYAFKNDNWVQAMTLFTNESQKFYKDLLCSLKETSNNSTEITDTILKDTNTTGSNELKTELLIFLWAIENEKFTVAKGLWMETENMMAAALLAYTCLKKMKKDRAGVADDLKRLQEMSRYYNDNAKDILTECSRVEKEKTKNILVRKRGELNGRSLLQIAQKNKPFIAHDACHSKMNEIYFSPLEIKQKHPRIRRILVCVLLPFLAPLLLRFRKSANEDDSKNQRSKAIKFRNQVLDFWHAPVVMFVYNVLSFVIFLALFAYDLMFDTSKLTLNDGIIIAYVVSIATEEWRQLSRRRRHYIYDLWHEIDRFSLQLFMCGKPLTHTNYKPEVGRVLLAFSFIGFSIRLLRVFESLPTIGPFLIMIKKMLDDTFSFMGIILVVMLCYAVSLRAILYPNSASSLLSFITAFKKPFWQIFGELVEVELEGDAECVANGTVTNSTAFCPSSIARSFTPLLLGFYMTTVQVLLINLLIAKFTHTIEKVQRKIEMHWRFMQCGLMREYVDRPIIVHPFSFFYQVYTFIRFCADCASSTNDHIKRQSGHSDLYCVTLRPGENISLRAWEKRRAQAVLIEKRRNPCPTCACLGRSQNA